MSRNPVSWSRSGALAVIVIDNPPVNAAARAVRAGLLQAVGEIATDEAVTGAVLACAGRTFVAGADITEFSGPQASPTLRDAYEAVEALAKPVVAVLHGTTLGGGLELALSCHYRVIDPAGAVGLPEVTLGLIPGAGGTQRLPRLIGLAPALDMITTARRVEAAEALRLGLVDAVSAGDRLAFARDFLLARIDRPVPRLAARPFPPVETAVLDASRTATARRVPGRLAPLAAVDVVAASAGLSLPEGLDVEQAAFEQLRQSPQSRALRHIFLAERAVGKLPHAAPPRALARIGVVGGGATGAGIAAAALLAGLPVTMVERDAAAASTGRARVAALLGEAVGRGKLSAAVRAEIEAQRFTVTDSVAALSGADLVVEAVHEAPEAKRDVFRALDAVVRPGAVLATGTSGLPVGALAAATSRAADVIGLHVFAPATGMTLVEVVAPAGAAADAVATGFALAKRLGLVAVWTGDAEGFIGNRLLSACGRAADRTVEDGASPWDVDAALLALGFPLGIFAMRDRAGLDLDGATWQRRDPAGRVTGLTERIRERGWLGRKTGAGYYRYENGAAVPHAAVAGLLDEERRAKGIVPRPFGPAEIQNRILLAMANEGARLLDAGVALRAGDIDVAMVNGSGFPRWLGGPMHAAEARGLGAVQADLRALDTGGDPLWRPAPLIARRVAEGQGSFNG